MMESFRFPRMGMHSGDDGIESFRCPRCDATVASDLKPDGSFPWPPHYVCPLCDEDEPEARPPPKESRRIQRQLKLEEQA